MSRRDFTANDIHLALDGELSGEEQVDFERWLDAHPEMKALSDRFARDRATLNTALASVLDEPVPPHLAKIAAGEARSSRRWGAVLRNFAAALLIFFVGGAGGYLLATGSIFDRTEPGDHLAENAIDAFMTYAADQPHAVEVDGKDRQYLESWLSKRIGIKLIAPDITADGFELLGGRILPSGGNAAALLVYKDKAGNQISIYVVGEGEEKSKGTYAAANDGPTAIFWLDEGYGCAIVGAIPRDRLSEVARKAWRQMVEADAVG
jgi:anti-sigma factor RsiW